jgi:hypothetical protein
MRTQSFAFDIWGDGLYVADLCQMNGVPNKVSVSESTHQYVKDIFSFEPGRQISFKEKSIQSYIIHNKTND